MRQLLIGSVIGGLMLGGLLFLKTPSSQPLLAASAGSIAGRIVLVGEPAQPKKIKVTKDNEKCGAEISAEDLVVSSDKGIKNAVVTLVGVKGPKADNNPVLDQKGCVFRPHVLVVTPGGSVDILNNDGVLHNFHTYSSKNPAVNKAQPGFKKKMTETFAQSEVVKVTCDAHPWMAGWIVVTENPAAVSSDGGTFKLTDVPAGTHKLEIWHETLGKITKEVSVKAGEETKVTIELSKK